MDTFFRGRKKARVERCRGWEVLSPTPHDVRRLTALQSALEAFMAGSEDADVAKLAKRPTRWVGLPAAPALSAATREFMLRRSCTLREFISGLLLPCVRVALDFPSLLAVTMEEKDSKDTSGSSDRVVYSCGVRVDQRTASLTRQQVWCVLANMFFRTFRSRTEAAAVEDDRETGGISPDPASEGVKAEEAWVDVGLLPTADYTEVFTARDGANGVEVTKLLLLFDFFTAAHAWTREEAATAALTAHRACASPHLTQRLSPKAWRAVHAAASVAAASAASGDQSGASPLPLPPLQPVVLHGLGESIDDQPEMIRVDFANRWIGGGALGSGAVQEEITFAQCPALNVLRWFHSRLGHAESVVAVDYDQVGCVLQGTYGQSLRYGEAFHPPRRCRGALLVVDALDFRFNAVDECGRAAVCRELMKLVGGLTSSVVGALPTVAGGNWGCGVFGGDYELKFFIQWAACTVAGKALHYFPFDNTAFADFVPLVTQRVEGHCTPPLTTDNLISFLYSLEDASDVEEEEEEVDVEGTTCREVVDVDKKPFGFVWQKFLQHFRLEE